MLDSMFYVTSLKLEGEVLGTRDAMCGREKPQVIFKYPLAMQPDPLSEPMPVLQHGASVLFAYFHTAFSFF